MNPYERTPQPSRERGRRGRGHRDEYTGGRGQERRSWDPPSGPRRFDESHWEFGPDERDRFGGGSPEERTGGGARPYWIGEEPDRFGSRGTRTTRGQQGGYGDEYEGDAYRFGDPRGERFGGEYSGGERFGGGRLGGMRDDRPHGEPYGRRPGRGDTGLDRGTFGQEGREDEWRTAGERFGTGSDYGPYSGRGPKGYQRSDDRVKEDVCEHLTHHRAIDATEIRVEVLHGEVTLDGTVENRAAKRMAEDCAERVSGVRQVHNRLRVQSHESGAEKSGSNGGTESRTGAGGRPKHS